MFTNVCKKVLKFVQNVAQKVQRKKAFKMEFKDIIVIFAMYHLALKEDVGIILAGPLNGSLLAGPEPKINESTNDPKVKLPPSLVGGPTDPKIFPKAHKIWKWWNEERINIRDLAIQFVLNAPINGNGIVLTGPSNKNEFEEVYKSATKKLPKIVWEKFEKKFDVSTLHIYKKHRYMQKSY